jgi:hypothetical protein
MQRVRIKPVFVAKSRLQTIYQIGNGLCVSRVTRRVLLVEHELPCLPERLRSTPVVGGVRVARSVVF